MPTPTLRPLPRLAAANKHRYEKTAHDCPLVLLIATLPALSGFPTYGFSSEQDT